MRNEGTIRSDISGGVLTADSTMTNLGAVDGDVARHDAVAAPTNYATHLAAAAWRVTSSTMRIIGARSRRKRRRFCWMA